MYKTVKRRQLRQPRDVYGLYRKGCTQVTSEGKTVQRNTYFSAKTRQKIRNLNTNFEVLKNSISSHSIIQKLKIRVFCRKSKGRKLVASRPALQKTPHESFLVKKQLLPARAPDVRENGGHDSR